MGKYLVIILILFSSLSYGQGFSNLGNTNPNDTARILYNWFLPIKGMRLPFYANADSNFLLIRPNSGYAVRYSLSQLISRVSSSIGSPGLQEVLDNGNDLDANNDIAFGEFRLGLNGKWLQLVNDSVTSEGLIEYTDNRRNEYTDRTLPDWQNVKDTLQEGLNSKEDAFSKGSLIAGTNVTLTGIGTGRLYGSGNLTINAIQPSLTGYVQFSDTTNTIATKYDLSIINWDSVMSKGNTTIASAHINHGSEALGLHASDIADHVYMSFYPDQADPDDRHAYFGYPADGYSDIELSSEKSGARIKLITNSGGVDINGGSAFYGTIPTTLTTSTIPAWQNVSDSISSAILNNYNSFDTTMSATVTGLTSSRFSRPISSINYKGITYNSDFFTQIGTTITFIGLVFYTSQKITFTFK